MKLKNIIAKFAPILGAALGGPAGGAIGAIVAKTLGRTEDDIIQNGLSPEEILQVKALETQMQVELQKLGSQDIAEVNETMRQEGKSEHWMQWTWRPFIGYVTGVSFAGTVFFIGVVMWRAIFNDQATALASIPQIIGAFTMLFSVPGSILGVASWHRGKMKRGV